MSKLGLGKTDWVLAGWTALHHAALDVGAQVGYDPGEYPELRNRSFADTQQYEALLGPMTQLLGKELEGPSIRTEPVRILIWRRLRTVGRRAAPDLWHFLTDDKHRVDPAQEYQRVQAVHPCGCPTSKPLPPILAARQGYRLLWQEEHSHLDRISRLIWGLALIGWSARHWSEVAICELCFRFTSPGARFCDEHTQRARSGTEPSTAYQRYRLGKKAHALAAQRGQLSFLRGDTIMCDIRRRLALSDVIFEWEYEPDAINDEMAFLCETLAISPRVMKRIGGTTALSADFETLTEILREQLDPYRWDPMHWGLVVLQAEAWFALEEELSPRKRGTGQTAEARIIQALALARNGFSNSQIANTLGISPSTVSKWIARGRFERVR